MKQSQKGKIFSKRLPLRSTIVNLKRLYVAYNLTTRVGQLVKIEITVLFAKPTTKKNIEEPKGLRRRIHRKVSTAKTRVNDYFTYH